MSLKRSLWSNFNLNLKGAFARCWALFFYPKNRFYFLGHVFLKYRPSACIRLFQILFQMHSFSNNNIVFSGGGWSEYFYFPAEFRLKIFLWIFLGYIMWHFCCLDGVKVILEPACRIKYILKRCTWLFPEMLLASNIQPMLCSYMLCSRFKCKISLLFWTIVLFSQSLAGKNGSCFIVSKDLHSLLS